MAAKKPELVVLIEDALGQLADVETLRFFGGWQFRRAGKQFAILMRDVLYFIADTEMRAELEAVGGTSFSYDKGGKTIVVGRYFSAPDDVMDDPTALRHWVGRALAVH